MRIAVARHDAELAKRLGKFCLEGISKTVEAFLGCGDYALDAGRLSQYFPWAGGRRQPAKGPGSGPLLAEMILLARCQRRAHSVPSSPPSLRPAHRERMTRSSGPSRPWRRGFPAGPVEAEHAGAAVAFPVRLRGCPTCFSSGWYPEPSEPQRHRAEGSGSLAGTVPLGENTGLRSYSGISMAKRQRSSPARTDSRTFTSGSTPKAAPKGSYSNPAEQLQKMAGTRGPGPGMDSRARKRSRSPANAEAGIPWRLPASTRAAALLCASP